MVKVYPAIIHKEDGEYWVEFPDLDGCSTYGSTVEKVMQLASEALGLYLVSLLEDGADLPEASDIESLEGRTSYIAADINKYRRDIGL